MRAPLDRTWTRLLSAALAATLLAGCDEPEPRDQPARPATEKATAAVSSAASTLPAHPSEIKYAPLSFEAPARDAHRLQLPNGLRIYFVPERSVPTLSVEAWFEGGEVYLPKSKRGLAELTGELMRSGGVEGLDARALDRRLDALAARIETSIGDGGGRASLWTLQKNADEALALFAKVLLTPIFADDRIRRAKDDMKDAIAHRDDDPDDALDHQVDLTLYGDHPFAWRESEATVDAITGAEIADYHRSIVVPNNVILAVSGDFDRDATTKRIEALFSGWKPAPVALDMPRADPKPRPGVFLLDRPLNQGFVEIVMQAPSLNDPDEMALLVMNYVLGAGGFTSRITQSVRNDRGLAYSAGSRASLGRKRPGAIGAYFQSKAESTGFATKLCFDEIKRIREAPITADELERAKTSLRDRFPERFATARGAAGALAQTEFDERPPEWFTTWRAKLDAVTADDVLRVARKHLVPESLSVVVCGPKDVVLARDAKSGAALADLARDGKVETLTPAE